MIQDTIVLPRKTKEGKPRISYSQFTLWNDKKSFNLSIEGYKEYIISYFLDYGFAGKGWGQFGKDVESYISNREKAETFTDEEQAVLNTIKPLDGPKEFEVDFGDFVLYGIVDDQKDNFKFLRDYKTGSINSLKQYKKSDYKQLKFYALKCLELHGEVPEMEVCAIERRGNCSLRGGREVLTVGELVEYVPLKTTIEELEELKKEIRNTVIDISENYKMFKLLNKK